MQNVEQKIIEIISGNFHNGIRDDFIDTNKILRIYSANYNGGNISRGLIANVIHANGIEDGGRFYFIPQSDGDNVKKFIDKILKKFSIVYYSIVHRKHADFFSRLRIFSCEVLKKILQEFDNAHFYFDEFCSVDRRARLDREISKIFAERKTALSPKDLQRMLPYVPEKRIFAVLSDEKKYLLTSAGTYISLSEIQFDLKEIEAARQKIFASIEANGFATPEDYSLSANLLLNSEPDEKNLRNIIYEKFFAADFTKRGKKLFKKNKTSTVTVLQKFIAEKNELSYENLFSFAENLGITSRTVLGTAYEKMIRAEKNLFVKDALINFDIDGVDEALESFVQGKIIPLRAVTSFTGFPSVAGYSWNLFLLESFLRKYSRQYIYATSAVNSSNNGAIHPKSLKFKDYFDVQAAAVVQENIPPEKSAVEKFLIEQGYKTKSNDRVTERVLVRAQEILNS